jgi:hypothetical protein
VTSTLACLEFELPFCRTLAGADVFARAAVFCQLGRRGCSQAACRNTPGCRFLDGVLCASVGCGHSLQYGNQQTLKGMLWRLLLTGRAAITGCLGLGWRTHALLLELFSTVRVWKTSGKPIGKQHYRFARPSGRDFLPVCATKWALIARPSGRGKVALPQGVSHRFVNYLI